MREKPGRKGKSTGNRRPKNGFTPGTHKSGPEAQQQTQRALRIAERQQKAFALLREGATFRQIAAQTGVSVKTAHGDCMTVFRELKTSLALSAAEWRALHLDRTEAVIRAHMGTRSKKDSADVVLRAMESQRRLIPGLEPEKAGCPRCAAAEARALELARLLTSVFISLTPEAERRREWIAQLRRRAPALAPAETPEPEPITEGVVVGMGSPAEDVPEPGQTP